MMLHSSQILYLSFKFQLANTLAYFGHRQRQRKIVLKVFHQGAIEKQVILLALPDPRPVVVTQLGQLKSMLLNFFSSPIMSRKNTPKCLHCSSIFSILQNLWVWKDNAWKFRTRHTQKFYTRLKILVNCKHSSVFFRSIDGEEKMFSNVDTW